MTKEVIEIRDTDPNVDEQIAQILTPKLKRLRGKWVEIAETTEAIRVMACEHDVPDARDYRYPMHREIKIDIKHPISVNSSTIDKVAQYIEHEMLRRNKSDAVLICETKDRVKKTRRKDKTRAAPKAQAKMIISSLNSIERVVNSLFEQINKLIGRATEDGLQVRLRYGDLNTLECFSEDGEDDVFSGFDL